MKPTRGAKRDHLIRTTEWLGVSAGDAVDVDGVRERRQSWVFLAHVKNSLTEQEWVEVRGGRPGEAKGRAFPPEVIYPAGAFFGSRRKCPPIVSAPRLQLASRTTQRKGARGASRTDT